MVSSRANALSGMARESVCSNVFRSKDNDSAVLDVSMRHRTFDVPGALLTKSKCRRPPQPHQPGQPRSKQKPPPLFGGTLTISIESIGMRTARTPEEIVLARLEQQVKLGSAKPSDEVEPLKLFAKWTPSQGVLALNVPLSQLELPSSDFEIVRWASFARQFPRIDRFPRIARTSTLN